MKGLYGLLFVAADSGFQSDHAIQESLNIKAMRKSAFIAVLLSFVTLSSMAQDDGARKKELGLMISESNFGIRYKTGNENMLARFTLFSVNGATSTIQTNPDRKDISNNFGIGFGAGFEKRKPVSDGLYLYIGPEFSGQYSGTINKSKPASTRYRQNGFSAGLGCVLGFHYGITDKINISSEIIPYISYYYSKESVSYDEIDQDNIYTGFRYGLNDYSINLTVSFNL